ncbi:MAG: glycosyltransferase family 4 protein [Halieaceae bacterium]|nr:glycosyltransferase family 4 protein [Halieaceae bacterium]
MKVLHVEAGRHLYGGARQVAYLLPALSKHSVESVLVCPPGAAIAGAMSKQCQVIETPMGGDLDLRFIGRLRKIIREQKPDLVHLHSRRGADTLGAIAAQLEGVRCVVSRRVDNPEPRWLVPFKYRFYDHVITISEGIARVLRDCGVDDAKITCVRSALDASEYDLPADKSWFCDEFDLVEGDLTIGVVAQLIPRKGHRYLLAAMPTLLEQFPRLNVLFFGQGPLEAELAAAAAEFGDHVRLVGFRDDLPRVLPNLDLLVHPADREGLGVSLIQAAAAGVPIVASRAGGMPEIVRDGLNGFLIQPGDVEELAHKISMLLAKSDVRCSMGVAGRDLVQAEFSVAAMAKGNLDVYRRVLVGP